MAPIVHGLEAEYGDRINFVYIDIDDPRNNEVKAALGTFTQPDFFLLDGAGNVMNRWTGRVAAEWFTEAFVAALEG